MQHKQYIMWIGLRKQHEDQIMQSDILITTSNGFLVNTKCHVLAQSMKYALLIHSLY